MFRLLRLHLTHHWLGLNFHPIGKNKTLLTQLLINILPLCFIMAEDDLIKTNGIADRARSKKFWPTCENAERGPPLDRSCGGGGGRTLPRRTGD